MDAQTLVLDVSYKPLDLVGWERAFTLLFEGKVEIVEEYDDKEIRTVSLTIPVPSIIRFLRKAGGTKRAVKFSRENIYARDQEKCCYCGLHIPRHKITYDHVLPRSMGGKTVWENIVTCCERCNSVKGARTPGQAGMKLRKIPVKPKFISGQPTFRLTYKKSMPTSWTAYLTDAAYWASELESDKS